MRFQSFASGSSGNCTYVGSGQAHVLIDAGISRKRTAESLEQIGVTLDDLDGIFITHEHSDHIQGLKMIAKKTTMPIFATRGTIEAMMKSPALKDMDRERFQVVEADHEVRVKDLTINPMKISHDAAEPVGYRILCGGKKSCVCTDLGCFDEYTVDALKDADVLLLEANHDVNMLEAGRYPYPLKVRILSDRGHLSNEASGRLLCQILHDNIRHIFLGHLSAENNYPALAYETVCSEVTLGETPYKSGDFPITVAKRDAVSEFMEF